MGHLAQKAQRASVPGAAASGGQGAPSEADGPAYRSYTSGPHRAGGTAPVPLVAGVPLPVLPAGVVDRNYWFPDRSRSPIRPLRLWTIGPIRSAWSL
ncbi:hypothetical protein J2Z79_002663 [Symbiobacterium terraclitae]|uniref:Uncharacterized protein n=1 Tax=Symbiobacterium terraclitae TaxID=557451 RepID=A0ABS4JUL4_9FIRM|nr:hypothetical protein [Symbiobacterium terraclitae]